MARTTNNACIKKYSEALLRIAFLSSVFATLLILVSKFIPYPYELLSHFKAHITVILIVCLAIYAKINKKFKVLILLFSILINAISVFPHILQTEGSSKQKSYDTRIMSINVLRTNEKHQNIINEIATQNPNIFILIEYTQALHSVLQKSDFVINQYPNNHHTFTTHNNAEDGVAIYSKEPIKIEEEFFNGKLIVITTEVKYKKLYIITGHLENPVSSKQNHSIRDQQIRKITEQTIKYNTIQEMPVIVIGDFNTTQYSFAFSDMLKKGGLKNAQIGFGYKPTWSPFLTKHTRHLGIQIDHALHTQEVQINNFKVGNFIGSDHYPIIIDLIIKTKNKQAGE